MSEIQIIFNSINYTKFANITNILGEIEITDLTLRHSPFPKITRETFQNFQDLHTLILDHTNTDEIKENAFCDLQKLKELHIVNNNLTNFKSNMLNSSFLVSLDLSSNSLVNLTDFNVLSLPSLIVLNVSDNSLEYLPINILEKIESTNNFYLIAGDNPWNCSHLQWKEYLSPQLKLALCSNISVLDEGYAEGEEEEPKLNSNVTEIYPQCSVGIFKTHCLSWMFGALWVGIILGNVKKLKQLVFCPRNSTMEDKATQCGNVDFNIF